MNNKKLKQINRHSESLFKDWVKTLLPEEEAKKVDQTDYRDLVPDDYHVMVGPSLRLSPNSPAWIRKKLKKLLTTDSSLDIFSVTLEDLQGI